jgi:hypothetical protein
VSGGDQPKTLAGLLTLEQQLLLKIVIRLGRIENKLDAQDSRLAGVKKQVEVASAYSHQRLYENCLGIQTIASNPDAATFRCRLAFLKPLSGYDPNKKA